jgi:Flp pilus assembly protein TadB
VLWLLTQVWVWVVVAFLLGLLTGRLFWARPLRRRVAELIADRAGHRAPAG